MNNNNSMLNTFGYHRDRLLFDQRRAQTEKRKQIQMLEAKKRHLIQTVKHFKRPSKWSGEGFSHDSLTPANVCGFVLSRFEVKTINDEEKLYSAHCADEYIPFRLYVTTTPTDKVTKISVSTNERSGLLEIQSVLDILAEEFNPHLVLMTISQYVFLNRFRQEMIRKLRSMNEFRVMYPKFSRGKFDSPWTILTNKRPNSEGGPDIEIKWTMDWERSYASLAHRFHVSQSKANFALQENLKQLQGGTFKVESESVLRDCWEHILSNIINP